jgi:hypothetical protein
MSNKIQGGSNATGIANVDANFQLKVGTETSVSTNAEFVGAVRVFNENDEGKLTGVTHLISPEVDIDFRQRVSQDLQLDEEVFNYTAQNTAKYLYGNTTMTNTWTAGQLTTNGSSITTTTTGTLFQSRAMFPTTGTCTLSGDFEIAFSAQPVTNTLIDFGFFQAPNANPYAPTDGVYFRLNSAGLQGISNNNGTETSTGVFPLANGTGTWAYTNNKRYQFIVYMGAVEAEFWVNDGTGTVKLGSIALPSGQGRMVMSSSLPLSVRHAIVGGAAGGVMQALVGAYNVRQGGVQYAVLPSTAGNRTLGSYQGLSGGTMGSLANYANSANPTAAVPTNTTAALGTGLGGQFWETLTLALTTDGIISSYQVPAGTANVQGKRLVIRGVGLTSYVQTAITGGPLINQYSLAFGHTAVSLATGEAATTKAPRRIALAALTQAVTAAQAVTTMVSQPGGSFVDFGDAPIYVNPGEFVALVSKKVGTVATAGVLAHVVTFVYGWE